MKNILIGSIIVLSILVLITATYEYRKKTPESVTFTSFPDASSSILKSGNGDIAIQTATGPVSIADIRSLPETVDVGSNMYHIDGAQSTATDGFELLYSAADNSFTVSIEKTPLRIYREKASEYFLKLFHVSQTDACKLHVLVGVPAEVDEKLAGKNLGLSFCPNSIQLQ